jgi:tRNA-intron endonuclease
MPLDDDYDLEEIEDKDTIDGISQVDGIFRNGKIYVNSGASAQSVHDKSYIGTLMADKSLELEIIEALLLIERNRIIISDEMGHQINRESLFTYAAQTDEKIWVKYLIYRDLRQRGYIVRLGYGDGIDFRVYPRGSARDENVAKYFICILAEGDPVSLDVLDRNTKQTLQARKELILAIVDRLGSPTYYELEQFKLQMNDKLNTTW